MNIIQYKNTQCCMEEVCHTCVIRVSYVCVCVCVCVHVTNSAGPLTINHSGGEPRGTEDARDTLETLLLVLLVLLLVLVLLVESEA